MSESPNHRYYCVMRPPAPGAIPRGALDVRDFGEKFWEPDVGRWVWGWAEYPVALEDGVADKYEMVEGRR